MIERFDRLNKKQKILAGLIVLIIILVLLVIIGYSRRSETLEQYVKDHTSVQQEIKDLNKNNVSTEIDKNTVIYTYDTGEVLEGVPINDDVKKSLQDALKSKDTINNCKAMIERLESKTKVNGVKIKMVYRYKDQVLAEKEYK